MSTPHATIRRATLDDASALAEFNRAIALETENLALIPEVILQGVRAVLQNPARGFYLVAEIEREMAGALLVTTEWSDWRNGEFWWIQSVYVAPAWRRRGVYRMLHRRLFDMAARDENACGLRLYVERENETAQKTYASLGMGETRYKIFEQLLPGVKFAGSD